LVGVELAWVKADHGYSAALAIASVAHLFEGLEQVSSGDWNLASEANDAAAALGCVLFVTLEFRV
jgi:hypothetical protein